jgi:hypothetical protein
VGVRLRGDDVISLDLVDELTPETRERRAARLRVRPGVRSVRIVD